MAHMCDRSFAQGVLWAAARIVEWHDLPTHARQLLQESGVDTKHADEVDAPFIAKALKDG